jgi:magnesium transporter
MEPDEAADALQALQGVDTEQATDLLGRMDRDEAADVEELVAYPSDTAGGLMTTDYIAVMAEMTVGQVLETLRARAQAAAAGEADPVPEALQEIYVVEQVKTGPRPGGLNRESSLVAGSALSLESEGRLVGLVAMRDLVLSDTASRLSVVMHQADAVAHPLDDARQVARLMADEDLIALPVVDDDGVLLGVVTIDDAIDVILQASWRQRLPRRFK